MNDSTFEENGKVAYVPVVVNDKPPKTTNADRIRSMADEELAVWLDLVRGNKDYPLYYTDWLNWLKQESE